MQSVFTDKKTPPTVSSLAEALGRNFSRWNEIIAFTKTLYPNAAEEWYFFSEKYGWSFRIKDNKRALVYLLPQPDFFTASFVFGPKAVDRIMQSTIAADIKSALMSAKVYAEGRSVRIDVRGKAVLKDIKELISIKISK